MSCLFSSSPGCADIAFIRLGRYQKHGCCENTDYLQHIPFVNGSVATSNRISHFCDGRSLTGYLCVHAHTFVCMHVCVCTYVCYVCTVCISTCMYVCMCMYIYVCICTYMCVCMYIHMYVHMYVCAVCISSFPRLGESFSWPALSLASIALVTDMFMAICDTTFREVVSWSREVSGYLYMFLTCKLGSSWLSEDIDRKTSSLTNCSCQARKVGEVNSWLSC